MNLKSQLAQTPGVLEDRLIDFAVNACRLLPQTAGSRVGDHIGGQLLRSATSSAANYAAVRGAESRRDFIHKMQVCLKELRESHLWLRILDRLEFEPAASITPLLREANELVSIFVKSIVTAKKNSAL